MSTAAKHSRQLMYDWSPIVAFDKLSDRIANNNVGYSFVTDETNNLRDQYQELRTRGCSASINGLIHSHGWDTNQVYNYLAAAEDHARDLLLLVHLLGGQAPRSPDILYAQFVNSASSRRAVFVHDHTLVFITSSRKARRASQREFYVARYLPIEAAQLWYYYLVYILPLTQDLRRRVLRDATETVFLFVSPSRGFRHWTVSILSHAIQCVAQVVYGTEASQGFGVQQYRQLSTAITERHIAQVYSAFNRLYNQSL